MTDRYTSVKGVITMLLAAAGMVASARTITVPAQPVSPWLDTEVSTNVVLHGNRTDTRKLNVHFQFEGTPTNCLEVAFGRDANTNGALDVAEIETVYGWRAGRYFIENVRAWERHDAPAAANAADGVIDIHLENDPAFVPKRFTATCGGGAYVRAVCGTAPAVAVPRGLDACEGDAARQGCTIWVGPL